MAFQAVTSEATRARIRATAADSDTGMVCLLIKYDEVFHHEDGSTTVCLNPNDLDMEVLTKLIPGAPDSRGEVNALRVTIDLMEKAVIALKEQL